MHGEVVQCSAASLAGELQDGGILETLAADVARIGDGMTVDADASRAMVCAAVDLVMLAGMLDDDGPAIALAHQMTQVFPWL